MRTTLAVLFAAAMVAAAPAVAADLKVSGSDTIESLIAAHKSKRVTVRLRSGQEITGTVREITPRLVHLGALSGRDFFDAVIALDAIEALVIRTRE